MVDNPKKKFPSWEIPDFFLSEWGGGVIIPQVDKFLPQNLSEWGRRGMDGWLSTPVDT